VLNLLTVNVAEIRKLVPAAPATATATAAQGSGATAGHAGIVDDPALEAEADRMGARASDER